MSVRMPMGVTALCSNPVSLFDSSSGASLKLNLFLGIRPSFRECTNWRTFSAFRRAVYCTMHKPNEDRQQYKYK
jgi:hypothetical protein